MSDFSGARPTTSSLFACFGMPDGTTMKMVLSGSDHLELEALPSGRVLVDATASNGSRRRETVDVLPNQSPDDRFRMLTVLFPNVRPSDPPPIEVLIGVWVQIEGGKGRRTYALAPPDLWGPGAEVIGGHLHLPPIPNAFAIQCVTGERSLMARLPSSGATLSLDWNYSLEPHAAVPRIDQKEDLGGAYGAFLAAGIGDAALAVGERLHRSLLGDATDLSRSDRIALGQWAMRVGSRSADIARIKAMLRRYPDDVDSVALEWLLGNDYPSQKSGGRSAMSFPEVVDLICASPPIFTQTLALLADRADPAFERSASDTRPGSERAMLEERFDNLLEATVWSSPTLTYRAYSPDLLEPASSLAGTKKKSERLGSLVRIDLPTSHP